MNILFLSDNFPPERNAPACSVYERACRWAGWGHRVSVITSAPNFPEGKVFAGYRNRWYQVEDLSGIRLIRVKTFIAPNDGMILRIIDFQSFMVSAFAAGLLQKRPDVVVATSPQFFTAVGACVLSELRGIPFVMEVRDLWPASISAVGVLQQRFILRSLEAVELFLYRRAAKVVVLTERFRSDLLGRGVPSEKVAVVRGGVDLTRFAPRPRDQELCHRLGLEGCFVVGYIGTHGRAHALEQVLEAAELLRGFARIKFLFVGGGAARVSLMDLAESRGLRNVVFVDSQNNEKMPSYWSICDVALIHLKNSPLFASVIPSKMFEAMAMGRPLLIAAPDGEATRMVKEAGCGLVVSPENPSLLAQAVKELCHRGDLVKEIAQRSQEVAPIFSRDTQAQMMIEILEDIVARSRRPAVVSTDHAESTSGR